MLRSHARALASMGAQRGPAKGACAGLRTAQQKGLCVQALCCWLPMLDCGQSLQLTGASLSSSAVQNCEPAQGWVSACTGGRVQILHSAAGAGCHAAAACSRPVGWQRRHAQHTGLPGSQGLGIAAGQLPHLCQEPENDVRLPQVLRTLHSGLWSALSAGFQYRADSSLDQAWRAPR